MSYESLSHSKWDCKYHVVFVPKYRKKVLYGKIRNFLSPIFHELAGQRRSKILEGHMVQDQVHMLIAIPPKYSVSEVVGYIKGKSAIAVARQFSGRKTTTTVRSFGQEDMPCQQLDSKKSRLGNTSEIKSNLKGKVQATEVNFK